jgi:hypothetical protein
MGYCHQIGKNKKFSHYEALHKEMRMEGDCLTSYEYSHPMGHIA